jgi:hypothetical protein
VTGGYEEAGKTLREMTPATRVGPNLVSQLASTGYTTRGNFVLGTQTNQRATSGWSSAIIDCNRGVYGSTLRPYLVPDDNTAIIKVNGTSSTTLASHTQAPRGQQRFRVTSTADQLAVFDAEATILTTSDRQYRNGSIGLLNTSDNHTTWDFVFIRPYSQTEPTASVSTTIVRHR